MSHPHEAAVARAKQVQGSAAKRILVVDDSAATRTLFEDMLAEVGHRCVGIGRADAISQAIVAYAPSLIVMSSWLPDGGVDFLAKLLANPKTQTIPVIVTLSRDAWRDAVIAFRLGAADCIFKPFHVEEVRVRVNAALAWSCARNSVSPGAEGQSENDGEPHADALEQLAIDLTSQLHASISREFSPALREVVELAQTLTEHSSKTGQLAALQTIRSLLVATQKGLALLKKPTSQGLAGTPLDRPRGWRIDRVGTQTHAPHARSAKKPAHR